MTNIITACFGGSRYANTRPAWLIDHGMVLKIEGVELPETYFVDFANSKAEHATRVLGNADGVVIPDQYFLSKAQQIYAWVYLTTGDSGFTTLQVTIPLAQRPDVTDEPPTPQETDLIEQAIAALNDGVERAETAAEDAEQSAEEAKAAAENIQQTVEDALQEAKDSGEFDGPAGERGPAGPAGPQGPKGDPGEVTQAEFDELSGDVGDLKSALKSTVSLDSTPVAFSVDGTGYVKYAAGDVAASTLSSHTNYIDVSYFKSLQYKRQGMTINNPASGMAFYDASFVYIGGESGAPSQPQGGYLAELRTIGVPPTAKYARFSIYTDVSTYGDFELYGETKIANDVNALNETVFNDVQVDFESAEVISRIIAASSGNWSTAGTSYIIPIESAKSLTVTSNTSQVSVIGILKTSNTATGTTPDYATGCSRTTVPKGQTKTFEIPSDAKYAAIMINAGSNIYTPESMVVRYINVVTKNDLAELEEAWRGITHEKPNSIGELNVVRRCRQMTDIKWTPAFDIPRISQLDGGSGVYFEDVFKAGVEYTGIPYGQANRHAQQWGKDAVIGFKPGWEIGFDTFISAVGNPESIIAKDSVYEATTGVHRASFYAIVCTALTGYALALPEYYPTDQQGSAPGMTDLGAVSSINLEDIHLGDMLWKSTHGAIITDKLRNSDGEIIGIEISEATTIGNADWNVQGSQYGGICRRRMWSLEDFAKWGNYHLYRYADVDSTPYEKSPFVDTGNEGDFARTMNFPVLPYMGENFKYVQGYIPSTKILTPAYRANETNKLRVMKDGNPWNENGTTDYYDVSGAYVSVGFSDVGTYEAYLCKLSNGEEVNKTKACHWTVVESSA